MTLISNLILGYVPPTGKAGGEEDGETASEKKAAGPRPEGGANVKEAFDKISRTNAIPFLSLFGNPLDDVKTAEELQKLLEEAEAGDSPEDIEELREDLEDRLEDLDDDLKRDAFNREKRTLRAGIHNYLGQYKEALTDLRGVSCADGESYEKELRETFSGLISEGTRYLPDLMKIAEALEEHEIRKKLGSVEAIESYMTNALVEAEGLLESKDHAGAGSILDSMKSSLNEILTEPEMDAIQSSDNFQILGAQFRVLKARAVELGGDTEGSKRLLEEILPDLDQVLKTRPDLRDALLLRADVHNRLLHFKEALKDFQAASNEEGQNYEKRLLELYEHLEKERAEAKASGKVLEELSCMASQLQIAEAMRDNEALSGPAHFDLRAKAQSIPASCGTPQSSPEAHRAHWEKVCQDLSQEMKMMDIPASFANLENQAREFAEKGFISAETIAALDSEKYKKATTDEKAKILQDLHAAGLLGQNRAALEKETDATKKLVFEYKIALLEGELEKGEIKIRDLKDQVKAKLAEDPKYLENDPQLAAGFEEARSALRALTLGHIGELISQTEKIGEQRSGHFTGGIGAFRPKDHVKFLKAIRIYVETGKVDTLEEATALMESHYGKAYAKFWRTTAIGSGEQATFVEPDSTDEEIDSGQEAAGRLSALLNQDPTASEIYSDKSFPEMDFARLEGGTLVVAKNKNDPGPVAFRKPLRVVVGKEGGFIEIGSVLGRICYFPPSDKERVVVVDGDKINTFWLEKGDCARNPKNLAEVKYDFDWYQPLNHPFSEPLPLGGTSIDSKKAWLGRLETAVPHLHLLQKGYKDPLLSALFNRYTREGIEKESTPEGRREALLGYARLLSAQDGSFALAEAAFLEVFQKEYAAAGEELRAVGVLRDVTGEVEKDRAKIAERVQKQFESQIEHFTDLGNGSRRLTAEDEVSLKLFRAKHPDGTVSQKEIDDAVEAAVQAEIQVKFDKKVYAHLCSWAEKGQISDPLSRAAVEEIKSQKDPRSEWLVVSREGWAKTCNFIENEVVVFAMTAPLTMGAGSLVRGALAGTKFIGGLIARGGLRSFAARSGVFLAGAATESAVMTGLGAGLSGAAFTGKDFGFGLLMMIGFHAGGKLWGGIADGLGIGSKAIQAAEKAGRGTLGLKTVNLTGALATQTKVGVAWSYLHQAMSGGEDSRSYGERLAEEAFRMGMFHYGTEVFHGATGRVFQKLEILAQSRQQFARQTFKDFYKLHLKDQRTKGADWTEAKAAARKLAARDAADYARGLNFDAKDGRSIPGLVFDGKFHEDFMRGARKRMDTAPVKTKAPAADLVPAAARAARPVRIAKKSGPETLDSRDSGLVEATRQWDAQHGAPAAKRTWTHVTAESGSVTIDYLKGGQDRKMGLPLVAGELGETLSTTGDSYARITLADGTRAVSFEPYAGSGTVWDAALLLNHVATETAGGALLPRVIGIHMHEGKPRLVLETFATRLDQKGIYKWDSLSPAQQEQLGSELHPDIVGALRKGTTLNHGRLIEADYLFVGTDGQIRMGLPRRLSDFAEAVYEGRIFQDVKNAQSVRDRADHSTVVGRAPRPGMGEIRGERSEPLTTDEATALAVDHLYLQIFTHDQVVRLNGLEKPKSPVEILEARTSASEPTEGKTTLHLEEIEFVVKSAKDAEKLSGYLTAEAEAGRLGTKQFRLVSQGITPSGEIILQAPGARPVYVRFRVADPAVTAPVKRARFVPAAKGAVSRNRQETPNNPDPLGMDALSFLSQQGGIGFMARDPESAAKFFREEYGEANWNKMAFLFSGDAASRGKIQALRAKVAGKAGGRYADLEAVRGAVEAVLKEEGIDLPSWRNERSKHHEETQNASAAQKLEMMHRDVLDGVLLLQLLPDAVPLYRSIEPTFAGKASEGGTSWWGVGEAGITVASSYAKDHRVTIKSTLGDLRKNGAIRSDEMAVTGNALELFHFNDSASVAHEVVQGGGKPAVSVPTSHVLLRSADEGAHEFHNLNMTVKNGQVAVAAKDGELVVHGPGHQTAYAPGVAVILKEGDTVRVGEAYFARINGELKRVPEAEVTADRMIDQGTEGIIFDNGDGTITKVAKPNALGVNLNGEQRSLSFLQSVGPEIGLQDFAPSFHGRPAQDRVVIGKLPGTELGRLSHEERKAIPEAAWERFFADLGKMNEAGLSHNDVTPRNILWDGRRLRLIDFNGSSLGMMRAHTQSGLSLDVYMAKKIREKIGAGVEDADMLYTFATETRNRRVRVAETPFAPAGTSSGVSGAATL